jgi:tRNA(fMet)-specific endonuclease VapC
MPPLILDSDTTSEILKGRNIEIVKNTLAYKTHFPKLSFTSATLLEVLYGYERIQAHAQIKRAEALFSANEEIVPTTEDCRLAATIAGALDRNGTTIGLFDPLIASCAIRRGYGVASGNTSHFEFIRKLGYGFLLENWRDAKAL